MEAKLQKAFFVLKDHVILPFLRRQAVMHCVLWRSRGRLGLGITAEMLTRLACTAFQERGRGSFGKEYVLLQILRVTALPRSCYTGTLSVKCWGQCQILQNPIMNPLASGSALVKSS